MLWVDPTDPSVVAAVTGAPMPEDPDQDLLDEVFRAVAAASEVLTMATAYLVHPASEQTEEFIASGTVRRFSPLYGPVTAVVSVVTVDAEGTERPVTGWQKVGSTVHLLGRQRATETPLWRTNGICGPGQTVYRITYRTASTVTAAARQALLDYAYQLFLAFQGSDECALPDRTTSVTREGVGIELMTPQDYLDKGRTGLPQVDEWLAQANPKRALRPSAVYTPDSPPGVGLRVRRL